MKRQLNIYLKSTEINTVITVENNNKRSPYIFKLLEKFNFTRKKMHYILKEKPFLPNFIWLLSIQAEKEKKSQRSRCCLNTLWFHFTLLISGWSLKSNSKGKWKYFTQIDRVHMFFNLETHWEKDLSFWKLNFDNWNLMWVFFFPLHEDLNHSRGNEIDLYQV